MDPLKHTFGGRALDRFLFDYEAVIEATPEAAPPAAPEPVAETPAPEPAAPAAPAFDLNDPATQQALRDFIHQETYTEPEPAQQAPADDFADVAEAFEMFGVDPGRLLAFMQQGLAPQLAPALQAAAQYQNDQAVQQVDQALDGLAGQYPDLLGSGIDTLSDLTDEHGAALFDPAAVREGNRDQVISTAYALAGAAQANGQNMNQYDALVEAAKIVRDRDEQIAKAAVERYKRTIAAIGGAPREPGAAGSAVPTTEYRPGAAGYGDAARAVMARNGYATD